MSKIRIVNWLLTRRCNLSCEYCAIVRDKQDKPEEYPPISHYLKNEMATERIISGLEKFKEHNPDCFHIFYGGEPLLRNDLYKILYYCNVQDINYTVISNNTSDIQPKISRLLDIVAVRGFTASVDPILTYDEKKNHRVLKTITGFTNLVSLKGRIKDLVAEVTVTNEDIKHLHNLVTVLSVNHINSDITFIDIAKSPYYDFSNITDEKILVQKNKESWTQMNRLIYDDTLDVHMKNELLPEIYNILPSNLDCEIDKNLHNVCIDSDGTVRLCLRIRGIYTPRNIRIDNLLYDNGEINPAVEECISLDKKDFCQKCNHTCYIMSKLIDKKEDLSKDLVHMDKRIGGQNNG